MPKEKRDKIIMLVEDDNFVADIYNTKLLQEGFSVILAANGQEALHLIKAAEKKPDLILLDIIMPYMGGLEVLKNLKKEECFKNIPVILLTNLSQKGQVDEGIKLGADDYIVKALFTPSEVLKKIEKYL